MKKWLAISTLLLIFSLVAVIFWYNEWRYSLPTPVPEKYHAINIKEHVDIKGQLIHHAGLPLFLHFFNPACPCSRFNVPHFKTLAAKYAGKIDFAIVVLTKDKACTEQSIREKFGLDVVVSFDSSLAAACGVYSTPQAVLLDKDQTLYYRGNYNRNRYCTNTKSNYAQMAIDSLLAENKPPLFDRSALVAYGCSLPGCKK